MDAFDWMVWTTPTLLFFCGIGAMLFGMTVWELLAPSPVRRGFLPMPTTRGDRFFVGLLSAAFIHLAWLAASAAWLPAATGVAAVWMLVLLRWG